MGTESKSKRGESGKRKAESSPFRLNGLSPAWQLRRLNGVKNGVNIYHFPPSAHGGSTTLRGVIGGMLAAKLGLGDSDISSSLARKAVKALERCPTIDGYLEGLALQTKQVTEEREIVEEPAAAPKKAAA